MNEWEHRKVLITVRTYPTPATRGIEVSCTAGITENHEWIRLFPVPYRFMHPDQKFAKYQWIELMARKASRDPRPESFNPDLSSIQVVGDVLSTARDWRARRDWVFPLKSPSMCYSQRIRDAAGAPTLAFVKPREIRRLVIQADKQPNWTEAELGKLRQYPLFEKTPAQELEKIPFRFYYEYLCEDPVCKGHNQSCHDWEMGETYRQWRMRYGGDWELKFRERWERDMVELNDTHFFVGTVSDHPDAWVIVGVWYPRIRPQLSLI
jgi:hypothetical protein